jgi:tetraacyldisaccharide 4'-kinase
VVAFAGIGRPDGFAETLEELGADIVGQRWFRDHRTATAEELGELREEARRRRAVLITTAKDAVKLRSTDDVWVLEVQLEPLSGSWDDLWRCCPGMCG